MRTLVNSEDPDEMPHKMAFHMGLHYFNIYEQDKSHAQFALSMETVLSHQGHRLSVTMCLIT